jgi:Flp pilus assembly protein TadG
MRGLTHPRLRRGERGASIIIVAFAMIAVIAGGALAIDAGNAWSQRRGLITATDAGALAGAQVYAQGGAGCTTAAQLFGTNGDGATMTGCSTTGNGRDGTITVEGEKNVEYYLAPVIGKESGDVGVSTTARWGIPNAVSGLRPFGLCVDATPQIQNYVRNGVVPTGNIVVTYGKSQPTACGTNVPGNWGMIDLNKGSNSNAETKDWVANGYQDLISAGTLGGNCTTQSAACYPGDTGAFSNSLNSELAGLVSSGEGFALPVFDLVAGNGSNSSFHLVAFLYVKLVAYQTNGNQANRSLTLQVTTGIVQGTCCQVGGVDTGLRIVTICAIEATNRSGCS